VLGLFATFFPGDCQCEETLSSAPPHRGLLSAGPFGSRVALAGIAVSLLWRVSLGFLDLFPSLGPWVVVEVVLGLVLIEFVGLLDGLGGGCWGLWDWWAFWTLYHLGRFVFFVEDYTVMTSVRRYSDCFWTW
jgi:hypothetical protein